MPSTMSLKGYVFDDGGAGKEDVDIKVFQKNTTATALATTTSGTGGVWTASWTPSDSNTTQVDVQGTLGTSVFRWKYDDKIAVSKATIGDLILTPTHNFSFILTGNPASADVTVTLPDASAGAAYTLAGLTVAQTFSAAQTFTSTVTVGSDGSGTDVIFYSGTSGDNLTWDASEEQLIITGTNGTTSLNVADGNVAIADDLAVDGTSNLDNTDIDGTLAVDGATISLDATTSLNIDNSNTSNGVTIGTATSGVPVSIGHATSETTINDNLTVTGTVDIGGGAIDGTAIGASSASTIAGTTIDATTDFTIGSTVITDDVVTFTPSTSDTVTLTASTNGAFSLVTVDNAAAAANIQITADGTVDIDSAGVLTLDSGAAINIEPASGSAILLDGTISIDAGVVTGVTALTSATIDATTDFTIGDTVITDGVITDSSGLQLAANLDINGTADISGDLTLSAGADGALQFTNAGENSIKIPDNQASALIVEEADNAYLTFVTTNSSEAVTVSKVLNVSAGINFPDTPALVADQNTLDDYEQPAPTSSNFTPQIADSSGGGTDESQAYNRQYGTYTKIGNRVFFNLDIRITNVTGLEDEQVRVIGLPFTSNSTSQSRSAVTVTASTLNISAGQAVTGTIYENTAYVGLQLWDAATGVTDLLCSELATNSFIIISGHYTTES